MLVLRRSTALVTITNVIRGELLKEEEEKKPRTNQNMKKKLLFEEKETKNNQIIIDFLFQTLSEFDEY